MLKYISPEITPLPGDDSKQKVEMETGYLIVRTVSDANGSNLPNATVLVFSEDGKGNTEAMQYNVTTDKYGATRRLPLSAPAKKYSLQKNSIVVPYAKYTLKISLSGYYVQIYKHVQVFPDTDSTHVCRMILLPAGMPNGKSIIYDEPSHKLNGKRRK